MKSIDIAPTRNDMMDIFKNLCENLNQIINKSQNEKVVQNLNLSLPPIT